MVELAAGLLTPAMVKTRVNPYIYLMISTRSLLKASLRAGREFFRPPHSDDAERRQAALVPIRELERGDRAAVLAHLLALSPQDRYLRFGIAMRDEQIERYTHSLDFERDEIYGIFNRRLQLIAMAHLARGGDSEIDACAEFGVSVDARYRGRGYGGLLFARTVRHARNSGVRMLFIHALSENAAMLHIAEKAGAVLERCGSETEAHLRLPPPTLDSQMSELVEDHVANTDYVLKAQAKTFWDTLRAVQEIRGGVQAARHQSSP